jgi:arabinofuranosyltransferase
VALLPFYYDLSAWRLAGVFGFPLDDAWIHAQFARNLANGDGFTFTGTRWVAGSTAPAWTVLLAVGYFFLRSVLLAGKTLGIVLQIASAVLGARLVLHLTSVRSLAIAAGLAIGALPAVAWGAVSGMEVPLAAALVLGAFWVHLTAGDSRRRQLLALVLFSLAVLARPENFVLLGVAAAHLVARSQGWRARFSAVGSVVLVAATVLGPLVLFDYWTTGRPLPTTFYAKSGPGLVRAISTSDTQLMRLLWATHAPNAVWRFGETLWDQVGVLTPVMLAGLVTAFTPSLRRRGAGLLAVSVVLAPFCMGLVAPQRVKPENFRYTAQFVCLAVVLGMAGLSCWRRLVTARRMRSAVLAVCVVATAYASARHAPSYALSVKNIEQLHVVLAEWVRTNLPPGSRIAANDVGALAYFGGHEVLDLEGLVSPEALAFDRPRRGLGFVASTRPDYIAIFPAWYPDIAARSDLFPEVHRVSIPDNVVSAGSVFVVYSTPWTRLPPLRRVSDRPRSWWPA